MENRIYLLFGSLFVFFFQSSFCLYPDQVGKFDWQKENVGVIKDVIFQSKRAFIATEAGVIASLNIRTGDLEWRKILESDDQVNGIVMSRKHIVSLSKNGNFVRMWHAAEGTLLWDASTMANPPPVSAADSSGKANPVSKITILPENQEVVVLANNAIYFFAPTTGVLQWQWYPDPEEDSQSSLAPLIGKPIELTAIHALPTGGTIIVAGYYLQDGKKKLLAFSLDMMLETWTLLTSLDSNARSITSDPLLIKPSGTAEVLAAASCAGGLLVASSATKKSVVVPIPGDESVDDVRVLAGSNGGLLEMRSSIERIWKVMELTGDGLEMISTCDRPSCIFGAYSTATGKMYIAKATRRNSINVDLQVSGYDGSEVSKDSYSYLKSDRGELKAVMPQVFERKDGSLGSRVLVTSADHSLIGLQAGNQLWDRQEALANVAQAVFLDMVKSSEVDDEEGTAHHLPSFAERLQMQKQSIVDMVFELKDSITGLLNPAVLISSETTKLNHNFGFEKLAICLTKANKLFAINLVDGSIVWSRLLTSLTGENAEITLFVTRQSAILGYAPEVVVVYSDRKKATTEFVMLDGMTGSSTGKTTIKGVKKSLVPLPQLFDSHERSVLMMIDEKTQVSFFPDVPEVHEGVAELLPKLFFHDIDETEGTLTSYMVKERTSDSEKYGAVTFALAAFPKTSEKVVGVAYPEVLGHPSLPAQVLGDDSLLLKYLNPHLVVVATVSEPLMDDPDNQPTLYITLVDSVSGEILHRLSHANGKGPVHMTITENWVVYSYWENKSHRTQIGALSLYEGFIDKHGLNPFNQPDQEKEFSAFAAHPPIILQKTFVFPHTIRSLGTTRTFHGITSKQILVALESGQILGLDRRLVDPRRPESPPKKQEAAEGLKKYDPFIPIIPFHMVSYYRQIERIVDIYAVPTRIESTSLLFAVGLDIYSTRVNPSKTFDLLPEEFNRLLLVLILGGMSVVTFVLSKIVRTKQLKAKWA